jgi:hypothetical protein
MPGMVPTRWLVSLRRHDAELGQMRPQGVDDLGARTYQQIARAVLLQLTLLFGRLDPHETHRRASNRLADRLRVGGIVLVAFDISFHILCRHQTHLVAELRQLPRPIMSRGTRLHAESREALEAIKAEVGSLLFSAMTAPRPHCVAGHIGFEL